MPDNLDRLLAFLRAKNASEKRILTSVAHDIFRNLLLMTPEERQLISLLALNTCPTGPAIDGDVHMNINLLARLSGTAPEEIISICSRIECLGFSYELTAHDERSRPKEILRLKYDPLYADDELRGNWTRVVHAIFSCIDENLCPHCRLTALRGPDKTSKLSRFADSAVGFVRPS